ncbi:MAG: FAD-dependent oxidoreductase, partial [Kiritimatiellae bacterium]|nr:FAD-dependent oxidoreductase [Kiritimatiellia bacterium]
MKRQLIATGLVALAVCAFGASSNETVQADVVVYGSSPAAISAAIQAKRMGRSVVVVSPETRIGGLTTGGLGQTDIGNKAAFGGIALDFYNEVGRHYGEKVNKWKFEPSAALAILEGWEKREGLDIRRDEWLDREHGVEVADGRIVSMKSLSGKTYCGKVFIDATYEGDLMAAAGVRYRVGREANAEYGETLNGNQPGRAIHHQLSAGVDPYVVPGDPKSGLLPGVEPFDPNLKPGDGDSRVQAYCFRMCLTDDPANRIPFAKPDGYDARDYELLFRHYEAVPPGKAKKLAPPWINSRMPNRKTDTNNSRGFSMDFIGQSWRWAEASYEEREKILAAHLKYQKGLMWTLANHPRVPESIRREVSRWGTCRDEFLDGFGDGWQKQLYVREARRMVGESVMTEHNCRGKAVAARPIAMGAYAMDSHHVRRYVGADGFVHNEGDVEVGKDENGERYPPYPIDYGAIVPKRGECANLLVPVCLSASHIAFGSIRMEPVFFALGQAAGTAAAIACAENAAVQDVPYAELRERLVADGQVVELRTFPASLEEIARRLKPLRTWAFPYAAGVSADVFVSRKELPKAVPNGPAQPWTRLSADAFFPFIDKYGQFVHKDWPDKVHSDADFARQREKEADDLAAHPGPDGWDKWGGWADGPQLEKTGGFSTTKWNGKWWIVDPDGHLWWSHGPVRVTPSSAMTPLATPAGDRAGWFEELPARGDPVFGAFYETRDALLWPYYGKRGIDRVYDFSAANIRRKYGERWFETWADLAHRRLRSWSCNTIANSSDTRICLMDRTPYTDRFEIHARPIAGHKGGWWEFCDPFDPSFRAEARRMTEVYRAELADPWCFGFFVDNEHHWGQPHSLALSTLK